MGNSYSLKFDDLQFLGFSTKASNSYYKIFETVLQNCTEPSIEWQFGEKNIEFNVDLFVANIFIHILEEMKNLLILWEKYSSMTGTAVHLFCLKDGFGMPPKGLEMWTSDSSGLKVHSHVVETFDSTTQPGPSPHPFIFGDI